MILWRMVIGSLVLKWDSQHKYICEGFVVASTYQDQVYASTCDGAHVVQISLIPQRLCTLRIM